MDQALAAHARLFRAGLAPGLIAVNVSMAQLLSDDFLEIVRTSLARHNLPPSCMEIEVTETVLLDRSVTRIVQTLAALRAQGISLSLDDFGTGYASLSSLTAFRVDRIKIDASFTRAIGLQGDQGVIARTIINLGRGLGLEVIAEGVETDDQLAFLANNGCDAVQGYLIAAPMLPDAAQAWLEQRPRPRARTLGILRG
jgi:EAL domain-containing protein (putative c-di-GMP-specific phosphodiesterase class I)